VRVCVVCRCALTGRCAHTDEEIEVPDERAAVGVDGARISHDVPGVVMPHAHTAGARACVCACGV
jgi:hypothetical protein